MYISEVKIQNFRLFGSGGDAFHIQLNPGLTAIVGENDAGKTAFIDALRFVLGTRDQESLRLETTDFHFSSTGEMSSQISIRIKFSGLTQSDRGAFAEYLTYDTTGDANKISLIVTWLAKRNDQQSPRRRYMPVEWRTGDDASGPLLDAGARFLLTATYLRPLRDAERAMSAGRGSRLSQILQYTKEIKEHGEPFNPTLVNADPSMLSVLGLGDYYSHLIENSAGVNSTRKILNEKYLHPLSFSGDTLNARVKIAGSRDDAMRLRQLLEKLEVSLGSTDVAGGAHGRGLGSNNLLFMACELLLLGAESEGFPLLLIEEPEAHLHPQRQIRLMAFLQEQAQQKRVDGQSIQIIVTTHSPNLASDVDFQNLVLIRKRKAFSMAEGRTKLANTDYRFLRRFLDVTKANLFFARGVMIVEGDAENILIPVIARLIGRDFREYGVSVVNVGGVGLRRYARVFMRADPGTDGELQLPVACVTDMDVMPNCAPVILGKLKVDEPIPEIGASKRRWRAKCDFPDEKLAERRAEIESKASEQSVRSFVADEWTLEYDLAFSGLAKEVWIAVNLAEQDDKIQFGKTTTLDVTNSAVASYDTMFANGLEHDELATRIYEPLGKSSGVSKSITAQYLAQHLEAQIAEKNFTAEKLREALPPYLVNAIEHVTQSFPAAEDGDGIAQ
jgi:putative ATP-dependent endonuclease of the OLD family